MREHIRVLGILNIIMGCLVALIGVAVLLIMGGIAGVVTAAGDTQDGFGGGPILAAIGLGVSIFFLALAAPSIIGGWGLLRFKPWSRILVIILSIFHLFHVPLGTALGVYGLWVLFSDEGRQLLQNGGRTYTAALPYAPVPPQATYPPPRL